MKYKVGDRVKIKSWKEMEEKYGIDSDGDIDLPESSFVTNMKKYCGKVMTISDVDDYFNEYHMKEDDGSWIWTNKMIKGLAIKITVIEYRELENGNIQIVGWKNVLKRNELPEEYLSGFPLYYLTKGNEIRVETEGYITYLGIEDSRFSKSEFKQIIKDMERAGDRLMKIVRKPKIKKVTI